MKKYFKLFNLAIIGLACVPIWMVKEDVTFVVHVMSQDQPIEIEGTVTGLEVIGRKHNTEHNLEFISIDGRCSGKSDVYKEYFEGFKIGDSIPLLKNQTGCILARDYRLGLPPLMMYIKIGFFFLLSLAILFGTKWKKAEE